MADEKKVATEGDKTPYATVVDLLGVITAKKKFPTLKDNKGDFGTPDSPKILKVAVGALDSAVTLAASMLESSGQKAAAEELKKTYSAAALGITAGQKGAPSKVISEGTASKLKMAANGSARVGKLQMALNASEAWILKVGKVVVIAGTKAEAEEVAAKLAPAPTKPSVPVSTINKK